MKHITEILGFVALVGLAACATNVHGTPQSVGITRSPSAAAVYDNGQLLGKTPMVAELLRRTDHRIRLELEGYAPYEIVLTRHGSGWLFGNILFGGIIGIIIDAACGAIYELNPDTITAQLVRTAQLNQHQPALVMAVALNPQQVGDKIGQMTPIQPTQHPHGEEGCQR